MENAANLSGKTHSWWLLSIAGLSGTAALGHQIVWTRALVDVAGASNATFSKVVGVFFLGLSTGAWFASRWREHAAPWKRLAAVEGLIAVLSLPMLFGGALSDWIDSSGVRVIVLQWMLPLGGMFLPAFAMGCSLPALIAVSGTRWLVPIYAINTLGGVLGIFLATFVIFPEIGLRRTGLCFAALNATLAGLLCVLQPAAAPSGTPGVRVVSLTTPKWTTLAFVSGFCVLGLEVLVQHQLAQVTINSMFSSAAVLAIILSTLGVGGILVLILRQANRGTLIAACVVTAILCAAEPFVFTWCREGLKIIQYELRPLAYSIELLKLSSMALVPLFLAAGLVFPLTLACAAKDVKSTGTLLAVNGAGGWLGTVVFDHALCPWMGLWMPVGAAVGLYGLLAVFLAQRIRTRIASAAGLILLMATLGRCGLALPQVDLLPGERMHALKASPEGVVATVERSSDDWRMLFNNSYTLGGSRAQFNQERQALLPLLLHGDSRSVAILGIATGSTTAGAILMRDVERIEAVELSAAVLEQARVFFGAFNRQAFDDPRVRTHVEDARWVISSRNAAYDVVIGDLFLPWRTGEGRLFSLEHFRAVERSLKPGGMFCQWLPLFQLTEPQFEMILATFMEVFPDTLLVRGDFYSDLPILGLVGNARLDRLDYSALRKSCETLRQAGQVRDPLIRSMQGVAMLLLGPASRPDSIRKLNNLANAALELEAGRNIIGLRTPWFVGVPQAQYFQNVYRLGQNLIAPELKSAHDAGQYVLTMEVAARSRSPHTENLKGQFMERIPRELLDDAAADWTQWPSGVKPRRIQ